MISYYSFYPFTLSIIIITTKRTPQSLTYQGLQLIDHPDYKLYKLAHQRPKVNIGDVHTVFKLYKLAHQLVSKHGVSHF